MGFIDQQPHQTDQETLDAHNRFGRGRRFACYLCGIDFKVGDTYRWVYANGYSEKDEKAYGMGNFFTCPACDGPDVLERWDAACNDLLKRFWWIDPLHKHCGG